MCGEGHSGEGEGGGAKLSWGGGVVGHGRECGFYSKNSEMPLEGFTQQDKGI